jgi:hypothetical protein
LKINFSRKLPLLYTQVLTKISRHAIGSLGARVMRLAGIPARPAAETVGEEVGKVLWLTKGSILG